MLEPCSRNLPVRVYSEFQSEYSQAGKIIYTMKEILLYSQKYPGKVALVDDEDYEKLMHWKWVLFNDHGRCYAVRHIRINKKSRSIKLHREIIGVTDPKVFVDHIDGDGLNNQRSNIRKCTHAQNMANRRPWKGKKYLGVSAPSNNDGWRARCKNHTIPAKTETEAAILYNEMAIKYHGEFARLNIISEEDMKVHNEYIASLPAPDTETHKTCKKCKESKLRESYNKCASRKDKIDNVCKICQSNYQKQIYKKRRELL